ncbi:nitroreductase [Agromyces rhizosphaerae]|uniref:Nitroreductase n=1 Tax=Agromyces rhizosphaerae TaxID=88374 RepID=A0A9W6CTJ4_9MICO|nr:nitroreductase family deazaflavin-dependent oxidoreductase [Agromyces rhizosphaerae]GLI26569.1 nitroreductase [Agromyces rhizosphaerae]
MALAPIPEGTRGPEPRHPGRFARGAADWMVRRLAAADGRAMLTKAIVVVTIGRKTGEERRTPVGWFPADGGWIVLASASGSRRHPQWYRNIAANPGRVAVETNGEHVPVDVEQLAGAERDAEWARIVEALPAFARTARKTDREFPILRLTRRAG